MDEWKAAFKEIFKKTPTKTDCLAASKTLRASLPKSPLSKKRKSCKSEQRLSINKSGKELWSPQKVAQFVRTADVKCSSDVVLSRPLLRSVVFNSPSKQCSSRCLDFDSPSLSVSKQDAFNLLKTPSPMKFLSKSVICTNVGALLRTPEKDPDTAEDGDEEFLGNDGVDVNNMEVTAFQPEAAKPKKQSRPRKSDGANYVRINLKKKKFAPRNKVNFKKKYFKNKRKQ
uniref:Uncharacterized protein n=1 Tax=Ditylenchus dipsaci TaxID=166011 RepID=A0A915EPC6_9BILA